MIGFISDVVGPVSMPLYSVVLYQQFTDVVIEHIGDENIEELKDFIKGREVSLVKKCLKTITSQLPEIMNKKGCDASNVYDEEARNADDPEYFSDDEQERAHKALKKKNKKKLAQKRAGDQLEEGEIGSDMDEGNKKKGGYSKTGYPSKKF